MKVLKLFIAVFTLSQCYLRLQSLEITLDGFQNTQCGNPKHICRSALHPFNITGRIILARGETMPPFVSYEYNCRPSKQCMTFNGAGDHVWQWYKSIQAGTCNHGDYNQGCQLLSGMTYRYYISFKSFALYRLCKIRARLIDVPSPREIFTPVNAPGIKHVSNEMKLSEYANDSRYSTKNDWVFDAEELCNIHTFSKNDVVVNRHLSGAVLMIFGLLVTITININVFN